MYIRIFCVWKSHVHSLGDTQAQLRNTEQSAARAAQSAITEHANDLEARVEANNAAIKSLGTELRRDAKSAAAAGSAREDRIRDLAEVHQCVLARDTSTCLGLSIIECSGRDGWFDRTRMFVCCVLADFKQPRCSARCNARLNFGIEDVSKHGTLPIVAVG